MLVVEELVKTCPATRKAPPVEALRGISFEVRPGEFFGLLGPNGAGKSTTIGCITTLVRATAGRGPAAAQPDRDLSVRELLTYHGRGLLLAVVLGPMMLFGCADYPWAGLQALGPVQYLFLLNPLVFISEAMRMAVTPEVPHMPTGLILGGLVGFSALMLRSGAASFERQTIL